MIGVATDLSKSWWLLLIQGILAIIFGVLALAWPGITLLLLVIMFGAFAIADGVMGAIDAVIHRDEHNHWLLVLLWGIISVCAGVVVFVWPGMSALILLFFIGAWAIVRGVINIVEAIRLRKQIDGEWLMILIGVWGIIFGIVTFAWPGATALAIVWVIGIYAIVLGVIEIILSFKVKGRGKSPQAQPA